MQYSYTVIVRRLPLQNLISIVQKITIICAFYLYCYNLYEPIMSNDNNVYYCELDMTFKYNWK